MHVQVKSQENDLWYMIKAKQIIVWNIKSRAIEIWNCQKY